MEDEEEAMLTEEILRAGLEFLRNEPMPPIVVPHRDLKFLQENYPEVFGEWIGDTE